MVTTIPMSMISEGDYIVFHRSTPIRAKRRRTVRTRSRRQYNYCGARWPALPWEDIEIANPGRETVLKEANVQSLDGEIEDTYRLSTDDEVSSAESIRVQRRLERDGVDVDALENDFITYQAIWSYLKDHCGVEYTPAEIDLLE